MSAVPFHDVCRRLKACCDVQNSAQPVIDSEGWVELHDAMTNSEVERVKRHLDMAGPPLLAMIKTEGTMDQRIGLLVSFYMYEIRKVDWSTLCIDAHVWDEIKREMHYNKDVYYRAGSFGSEAMVHNVNALHSLFEASKSDSRTFKSAYLMFKLALV